MLGQILEVQTPGRRLSQHRGFIEITDGDTLVGSVPLSDIEAVLLSTPLVPVFWPVARCLIGKRNSHSVLWNRFQSDRLLATSGWLPCPRYTNTSTDRGEITPKEANLG